MRPSHTAPTISLILAASILLGCAGNPAIPDMPLSAGNEIVYRAQAGANNHRCMGYYTFVIDQAAETVDVIENRAGLAHLNLAGIMNSTMGITAAGVPSEHDIPHGLFVFDVTIKHPFAAKPQFSGFDVKGILLTPGTLNVGSLVFADTDETRLENADGYTRWWNPSEFTTPGILGYTKGILTGASAGSLTATVNPYKYFADVLSAESQMSLVYNEPMSNDKGRGVFSAGSTNTRRYRIRFEMDPGPQVVFGYAVDVSWAPPLPNPPSQVPDDFPINANQPEAYYVLANPVANTLYYDTETGHRGGVIRLQVNVHDWQGQAVGNIPGEVDAVRVFAPDLFTGGVSGSFLNETALKARYIVDCTGTAIPSGPGWALMAVRVGSEGGPGYKQGTAAAPDADISAFATAIVEIIEPVCTADSNNDWIDAEQIQFGDYVTDQLCAPTDYRDFFKFEIPPGYLVTSELVFWCDANPSKIELYDLSQNLIIESAVSAGKASINLEALNIMPDEYFIRVYTSDNSFPAPYLIEFTGELVDISPANPVEITPEELYIDPRLAFWKDDYLYLQGYVGMWICDAGDPASPQMLKYIPKLMSDDFARHGNYIYYINEFIMNDFNLRMMDISDPLNPVFHEDILHFTDSVTAITMNSTHLFVADDSVYPETHVDIYDWASDPTLPVEVASFEDQWMPAYELNIIDPEGSGTTLVVGHSNRICTFDVEDLMSITQTGSYTCTGVHEIAIHNNYIYLTGSDATITNGLFILGYSKPIGLVPMGKVDLPGGSDEITVNYPTAFISDVDEGLAICDVSDAWLPAVKSSTPLVSDCIFTAFNGNILCAIPEGAGFEMFDVTTPDSPDSLFLTHVLDLPLYGGVIGDHLVVNDAGQSYWAVKSLDISNPLDIHIVDEWLLPFRPVVFRIYPEYELAVTAGTESGTNYWILFDVSDPANLDGLDGGTVANEISAVAIRNGVMYLANSNKLDIYDIGTSTATHEATVNFAQDVHWIDFASQYMYASRGKPLELYSVVDPLNPVSAGTYDIPQDAGQVLTNNGFLYIVEADRLEIVDISNPGYPSFLGAVLVGVPSNHAGFVTVDGQYAYVTGFMETTVCSIWPPDNPTVFGTIPLYHPRYSGSTVIKDGVLYGFGFPGGMLVYDLY